jgi:hypothetical protein
VFPIRLTLVREAEAQLVVKPLQPAGIGRACSAAGYPLPSDALFMLSAWLPTVREGERLLTGS